MCSRAAVTATAAAVCVSLLSTGCQVRAHHDKAYVRRAGGISLLHATLPPGEALIKVRNENVKPARVVLARVDSPQTPLPVGSDGTVPVGGVADLEYDGDGYRVLLKPDDLAPYFAHGRTETTLHLHLKRDYYVLFSNRPGDYRAGGSALLHVA